MSQCGQEEEIKEAERRKRPDLCSCLLLLPVPTFLLLSLSVPLILLSPCLLLPTLLIPGAVIILTLVVALLLIPRAVLSSSSAVQQHRSHNGRQITTHAPGSNPWA